MLVLDPNQRPSADVLLKSSVFDEIRKPSLETPCSFIAELNVDKLDNEIEMTMEDYYNLLEEELAYFN